MNEISKTIEEVLYPSVYWWNKSVNPEASVANGLGNCTCYVYGEALHCGLPAPVSVITDASHWHKHLINGWMAVPYQEYKTNIKKGDILEWVSGNHVAICSNIENGKPWISGSFYTGTNGKAYSDGGYSTREGINSLKQLNDYMVANFPYRFFHYVTLDEESQWCGGDPEFVLVSPVSIVPVEKDSTKNQIYVGITGLRVRTEPNTSSQMRGVASTGYYSVSEVIEGGDFDGGNIWYKIGDLYVASVEGVQYYPKDNTIPIDEMMKLMKQMQDAYMKIVAENDELKQKLKSIEKVIES